MNVLEKVIVTLMIISLTLAFVCLLVGMCFSDYNEICKTGAISSLVLSIVLGCFSFILNIWKKD